MSASSLVRRVAPPAGAIALLLALAPAASAARVDLAGGDTNVRVDRGTLRAVTGAGIALAPTGAAEATGRRVRFPITGGRIDPASGAGRVDHRGGLRFSRGGRSVKLTRFRIQGRHLSALAGGDRVRILRLRAGDAVVRRTATTTTVSGVRLELTRTAARALNAALGTHLFARGIVLGSARVHARLGELFIQDGSTSLAVDAGAASALASQGIVPGLIAPASANSDGSLAFPITRGRVDAGTFAGLIRHSGGLSLTKGSTRVELTRFDIGIDSSPQLTALVGGSRVPILNLDLSGLTQDVDGLDVTLGNVRATLTAQAAAALNQAFGTTAFSEGLLLGVATVRAEL
ncbi:MAG TPA: hypothetical protein VFO81_02695 [Gaiellaceae bacterium]|nr:hypothetical protein [Gaiellaceae bacterium]